MRTAQEMTDFCLENGLGQSTVSSWTIKHFAVVEKQLLPGEEVNVCFMGLHNYISTTKHSNNYAYAVTDTRIIMAQQKLIGENVLIVSLNNLNDVTLTTGLLWGTLTFDTIREKFNVGVNSDEARNIHEMVTNALFESRKPKQDPSSVTFSVPVKDPYEELKKLKELLDLGIVTQEEFDRKKAALLQ